MKKTLAILLLSLLGISSAYSKTLTWATEASYPPFVLMSPSGKIIGMDADIAHAICKQMHAQCKFVNAPWDSLIEGLKIGRFDLMWGGMTITAERAKKVSFSQPYYFDSMRYVAKKGSDLTFTKTGLKGKTIGTQKGDIAEYYLDDTYGKTIHLKTYGSIEQAFMDLKIGRLDAILADQSTINAWLKKDHNSANYALVGKAVQSEKYKSPGNGIAVAKGNTALLKKVNQAITVLQKNGSLKAIIAKYQG